jgi:putative uncharacterized protein sb08g008190
MPYSRYESFPGFSETSLVMVSTLRSFTIVPFGSGVGSGFGSGSGLGSGFGSGCGAGAGFTGSTGSTGVGSGLAPRSTLIPFFTSI